MAVLLDDVQAAYWVGSWAASTVVQRVALWAAYLAAAKAVPRVAARVGSLDAVSDN